MRKTYKVTLTPEERQERIELVSTGKSNAQKIKHVNILLAVDESENKKISNVEIAKRFHCHAKTMYNIRECCVKQGFEAAFEQKNARPRQRRAKSSDMIISTFATER